MLCSVCSEARKKHTIMLGIKSSEYVCVKCKQEKKKNKNISRETPDILASMISDGVRFD